MELRLYLEIMVVTIIITSITLFQIKYAFLILQLLAVLIFSFFIWCFFKNKVYSKKENIYGEKISYKPFYLILILSMIDLLLTYWWYRYYPKLEVNVIVRLMALFLTSNQALLISIAIVWSLIFIIFKLHAYVYNQKAMKFLNFAFVFSYILYYLNHYIGLRSLGLL